MMCTGKVFTGRSYIKKRRFLQYTSQYKKVYWDLKKNSSTFLYWEVCTVELKEQPN